MLWVLPSRVTSIRRLLYSGEQLAAPRDCQAAPAPSPGSAEADLTHDLGRRCSGAAPRRAACTLERRGRSVRSTACASPERCSTLTDSRASPCPPEAPSQKPCQRHVVHRARAAAPPPAAERAAPPWRSGSAAGRRIASAGRAQHQPQSLASLDARGAAAPPETQATGRKCPWRRRGAARVRLHPGASLRGAARESRAPASDATPHARPCTHLHASAAGSRRRRLRRHRRGPVPLGERKEEHNGSRAGGGCRRA